MIKLEDLTKGYIYSELKNNYKEFEDINILNNVYFQGPHSYSDAHGIADAQYSGSDVHAVDYLVKHGKESILEGMQVSLNIKTPNHYTNVLLDYESFIKTANMQSLKMTHHEKNLSNLHLAQ